MNLNHSQIKQERSVFEYNESVLDEKKALSLVATDEGKCFSFKDIRLFYGNVE